MKAQLLSLIIIFSNISGYSGAVDSVTVDSAWNSDSSWYENRTLQQRTARDCLISFYPRGTGVVYCSLTVSLDTGKSWNPIPDPLRILGGKQNDAFQCGVKGHIKARIFGGDRPGVAFKIIANTCNVRNPQSAFTSLKFGAMISYNMSTYDRCCCSGCYSVAGEWGLSNRDPKMFRPTSLHCGQWADAAKSAGCNYMVLTVKHHDGFCLWPTKHTEYCVKNAACTTNIVKEFVDSARNRGMKVGFYYSIRDLTNGHSLSFIKAQLTELLSDYGELTGLWFDGWGWAPGYKTVPFDSIKTLVKRLQPYCLIIENNHDFTLKYSEIIEYEIPIDSLPPQHNILPAEGREPIRIRTDQFAPLWFWHPDGNCDLWSAENIILRLKQCNSRNANYILTFTPDTSGQIPQCQYDRAREVGQLLGGTE